MDNKRKLLILGMVLMGAVVFMMVRKMGAPAPTQPVETKTIVEKVDYTPVLAVNAEVVMGQRLSEDILTSIEWPTEAVTPNLVVLEDEATSDDTIDGPSLSLEDFIGSVAKQNMVSGEVVTSGKVIMAGDSGLMAALLAPGMRAVTTQISVNTAAGGFIQPGDRVDVILRENLQLAVGANGIGAGMRKKLYVANTLFENVKVLAIDQVYSTGPESQATVVGSTATFELSQQDAELLQEATGYGNLYLTLRGTNAANAPAPSAATVKRDDKPSQQSSLIVYRDGQATTLALKEK